MTDPCQTYFWQSLHQHYHFLVNLSITQNGEYSSFPVVTWGSQAAQVQHPRSVENSLTVDLSTPVAPVNFTFKISNHEDEHVSQQEF